MSRTRALGPIVLLIVLIGSGLAAPTGPAAAQAGDCEQFVADVTIPDGMLVEPSQEIDKVWRVTNCGSTTWGGYRAVRINGTFGPDSFEVPRTPPGATVDLAVRMRVPATLGLHWATYRLAGGNRHFGGFGIVVDIADCGPPEVESPVANGTLDPRTLPLRAVDLGGRWCLLSRKEDAIRVETRYSSADYPSPRRARFWVGVFADEELAEQALFGFPRELLIDESPSSWPREQEWGPWEVEGATGQRGTFVDPRTGWLVANYLIRVDRIVSRVEVSGGKGEAAEMDAQARALALAQLERVRGGLAAAPPPPPTSQPAAEALYEALLTAPFEPAELPERLTVSRVRPADSDRVPWAGGPRRRGPEPVGSIEVALDGSTDEDQTPYALYYRVFRTRSEAQQVFEATVGGAYIYLPGAIAHPSRCGAVMYWVNRCWVLAGNVVIDSVGKLIDVDIPYMGDGDTPGPDVVELAQAGTLHLGAIRSRIAMMEPDLRTSGAHAATPRRPGWRPKLLRGIPAG